MNYTDSMDMDNMWLTFRLEKQKYALSTKYIENIAILPSNVTPMPNTPDFIKGVVKWQQDLVALVDLRKVFGFISLEESLSKTEAFIEKSKEDHIIWVKVLEEAIEKNEPFTLSFNPHECNFGRWYDEMKAISETNTHEFNRIDEPHKRLHYLGEEIEKLKNSVAPDAEKLKEKYLLEIKEDIEPYVLKSLDEAKQSFRENRKEMLVCLNLRDSVQNRLVGFTVDEVYGIEVLDIIEEDTKPQKKSMYISSVAKMPDKDELVLLVDVELVIKMLEKQLEEAYM